jgi:hypothetical protein
MEIVLELFIVISPRLQPGKFRGTAASSASPDDLELGHVQIRLKLADKIVRPLYTLAQARIAVTRTRDASVVPVL